MANRRPIIRCGRSYGKPLSKLGLVWPLRVNSITGMKNHLVTEIFEKGFPDHPDLIRNDGFGSKVDYELLFYNGSKFKIENENL